MIDPESSPDLALLQRPAAPPAAPLPLSAILITEELRSRTPRAADHALENRALATLVQALGDDPRAVLQTLSNTLLDVFKAGSAGVSLLSADEQRFYWSAVAGGWRAHVGGGTPRHFSPCGDVLDCNAPLLFRHIERRYPQFLAVEPVPEECLLVPFHVAGKTVGTLWVVAHDPQRRFDAEDLRLLESLGRFAAAAWQAVASLDAAVAHTHIERGLVEQAARLGHDLELKDAALRHSEEQDIALRKQTDLALGLRTAQFETLLNEAPIGVHLIDADFRLRHINPAGLAAFGTIHPLIGRDFAEVMHIVWPAARAEEIVAQFRHTLQTGEPCVVPELADRRADRQTTEYYEWQISRIPLPDGRHGVVCYFRDISTRVLAQEKVRENEARFRAFVTASSDVVYQMSPDWREMQYLQGRSFIADTVDPSRTWEKEYIHPEDQHRVTAAIQAAIASKGLFEIEHRVWRVDGSVGWTRSRAVPLLNAAGEIVEWFGTANDITQAMLTQQALHESEERYRSLFNSMDEGYCIIEMDFDAQGVPFDWTFLEVNPAFSKLTGVHDVVGKRMLELAPDHEAIWFQTYGKVALTGESIRFVNEAKALDSRWFDLYAFKVGAKESRKVAVLFNNITERKRAEEALRASEELFRATFEHAAVGIVHVALDNRWLRVNPAMCRLTGYTAQELTAMHFSELTHADDLANNMDQVRRLLAGEIASYTIEKRFIHRSGRHVWVTATAALLRDAHGAPQYLIGAIEDISQKRATLAQLSDALAAAEAANHAKSDFLSSMSHELRSPLNAVLGFAQLLQTGTPPPTPLQQEAATEILKAGWYLLGLINQILDLTLIESGRLAFVLETVPLAEVLDDCRAIVEGQAEQSGITLHFEANECTSLVSVDRQRLKQVFINILSNAIKYNRPGGGVRVGCDAPEPGRVRVRVEDSGIGLSAEQIDRLFQPFERLGREAGVIEGTGIGLALSKRLITLMGGRIGVLSTVGQGSVFWVELHDAGPATAQPACASQAAEPPAAVLAAPPSTVLCIEDNASNVVLVQRLLARRANLRLLLASDGEQGLALARTIRPDVVLMDINLPGLSGLEAMRQLADDATTAHIPVVAVSAHAMRHDIYKGLQAGFFRYLTKPIHIDEFMEALDAALALAHAPSRISPTLTQQRPPHHEH